MANLEMIGYTVLHYESTLLPAIQKYTGECRKHLDLECRNMVSPDDREAVLTFDISTEVCLPEQSGSSEKQPIVQTNGRFMFSFTTDEEVPESILVDMSRNTGVQMAVPIIRGIIAGMGNMLNHPDVYDFPTFNPEIIQWRELGSQEE